MAVGGRCDDSVVDASIVGVLEGTYRVGSLWVTRRAAAGSDRPVGPGADAGGGMLAVTELVDRRDVVGR